MRRFSQRNQLVTLNEINITPLLDLAFVLLIIFVITSPLLEQSLDLRLPGGGDSRTVANAKDVVVAEVSPAGVFKLGGRTVPNVEDLRRLMAAELQKNPNLVLRIRADRKGEFGLPMSIIDAARSQGITRFEFATEPISRR